VTAAVTAGAVYDPISAVDRCRGPERVICRPSERGQAFIPRGLPHESKSRSWICKESLYSVVAFLQTPWSLREDALAVGISPFMRLLIFDCSATAACPPKTFFALALNAHNLREIQRDALIGSSRGYKGIRQDAVTRIGEHELISLKDVARQICQVLAQSRLTEWRINKTYRLTDVGRNEANSSEL
jgi:hypothetical protein